MSPAIVVSRDLSEPSQPSQFRSRTKTVRYMLCGGFGLVGLVTFLALYRLPWSNAARLPDAELPDATVPLNNDGTGSDTRKGVLRGPSRQRIQRPWHRYSDRLCNDHWTWSGVTRFWTVVSSGDGPDDSKQITWSIERANTSSKESASWSTGKACGTSKIQKGTALVVIQSPDRFSVNIWHQLTAIFEGWITPRVLQLLKVLPPNISVSYYVPALGDSSVEKRSGIFDWQMLGPTTTQRCGFEHFVRAPGDGFLWDLAWDLPLCCARAPELWRDFQQVLYAGMGLKGDDQNSTGRSLCYVGRPGSDRELSNSSLGALKAVSERVLLNNEPLILRRLIFTRAIPISVQAARAHSCDILMGPHGAGLVHALWLYPGSVVIEILDQEHHGAAYYRNLAHLSGLIYFKHSKAELEHPEPMKSQMLERLLVSAAEVISNKASSSLLVSVKQS